MGRSVVAVAIFGTTVLLLGPPAAGAPSADAVLAHIRAWESAYNAVDTNAIGDLTCDRYRHREMANNESRIPGWDDFVQPRDLHARFPKLTGDTLGRLVGAARRRDQPAFRAASIRALTENSGLTVTKIDRVAVVDGSRASATVTTESTWGAEPPRSTTSEWFLVYERDGWRYCNPVATVR